MQESNKRQKKLTNVSKAAHGSACNVLIFRSMGGMHSLASVSLEDVRDILHVDASDVPDDKSYNY